MIYRDQSNVNWLKSASFELGNVLNVKIGTRAQVQRREVERGDGPEKVSYNRSHCTLLILVAVSRPTDRLDLIG